MLLERERELGEIEARICEVADGRGHAIGIEAHAGLGKTRLLQEARETGTSAGLNVLSGRATELERDFPFALVRQLFEPQLAALSAQERGELFEGARAAEVALGIAPSGESSHDAFAVLHGLYWVTAALAEREPLLLAVDDAHTADAPSLDYLGFLLPRLQELPVLLVITNRPDEPDPTGGLRRVLTDPAVRHLAPGPLSVGATATLLNEGLGRQPDAAFTAACHEVSGGNPFLLSELVRTLAERGVEPVAEGAEAVRELAPDRVAQSVLMRIERLGPASASVARSLAVFGEGADLRLVAELAGVDAVAARSAADQLRATAIFDPSGMPPQFTHPLVRNAVYAEIPAGERARLHAQAARLLRQSGAATERIATQLLPSEPGSDRATVETLIEAGEKALAAGAPRSAIAYLRRALDDPPPDDLRAAVLEPLVTACFRAVDHGAWAEVEREVLAELEREPSLRIRWATPLTWVMAMGGRFEEAASMLVEAVEVAIAEEDVQGAFQLEAQLATLRQIVPSVPEVDLSRYADQIEPDSPGGRLAAALEARSAAVNGSAREVAEAAKRALGNDGILFAEEPEITSAVLAVLMLVIADELDSAAHVVERSLAMARERGATPEIARSLHLRGVVSYACGNFVESEADLRQAMDLARLAGIQPLTVLYAGPLIEILIERDELEEADKELQALGLATGPMPEQPLFSLLVLARGHLRFVRGELEPAMEDFLALQSHAEVMGAGEGPELMVVPLTARALVEAGERTRAREHVDRIMAAARRWGTPRGIAYVMRAVATVQGGDEGIKTLEEAAAMTQGPSRRVSRAEILLELGEALRRGGRRVEAREPLREALQLARQGGAARIAKRAHEELQATGETVRRYTPIGIESLTPSERRVADLAASGMTNRQIAQSLFVTVKTVEAHLSAAYDKLDISSRQELPQALGGGDSLPTSG